MKRLCLVLSLALTCSACASVHRFDGWSSASAERLTKGIEVAQAYFATQPSTIEGQCVLAGAIAGAAHYGALANTGLDKDTKYRLAANVAESTAKAGFPDACAKGYCAVVRQELGLAGYSDAECVLSVIAAKLRPP